LYIHGAPGDAGRGWYPDYMQMTRRTLAAAVMAPAAALLAQNPATKTPAATTPPTDDLESARRQIRNNAAALSRFELAMATEPAFRFAV
jgi:hypothetical protein